MTDLLLVGAGHTHLYLVRHAGELVAAGYRVHLLAPRFFHYSGLASAIAAGAAPAATGRVDVAALAGRSGVTFHEGTLVALDLDNRLARDADGSELRFDVVSLNIGSVVAPLPGATVEADVRRVKPLSDLHGLSEALESVPTGARVTVVGGGASGVELAAHLSARRGVSRVHLLEAASHVGDGLPAGARRRVRRLLADRGAVVRTGCAVAELSDRSVRCADGTVLEHDAALLATGLSAPPLVAGLGLGDHAGVPVRETLQHVDHDDVYAVGDCARFLARPLPRIGVHGVRQGPVLHRSLLARAQGQPLPAYRPQRRALSVLDLGGGTGLATWGPVWWEGRSALRLKRLIDRRWLRGYQGR